MDHFSQSGALAACAVLAGCAATPDVTVSYFFPKAETQLHITQTLACPSDASAVLSTVTVTPTTTYSSDLEMKPGKFNFKSLSSSFANSDISLNLTEDGRLLGVNASSEGQGGTVIENAVAFAALFAAGPQTKAQKDAYAKVVSEACKVIKTYGGDKPVTLTYGQLLNYASDDTKEFQADLGARKLYEALRQVLPGLVFRTTTTRTTVVETTGGVAQDSADTVQLELNRHDWVSVQVEGPDARFGKSVVVWQARIAVPSKAPHYYLPIPKAQLFGKQGFSLTLSPYGSIQKLQYATSPGANAAAATALGALKELRAPSVAEQANELKAQADLIAQQQRLLVCQAKPADCK